MKWLALCAAVLLPACNNSLEPFQPEIGNATDNFQFQVTGTQNLTLTRDYVWVNTGTSANVNQATTIAAGTATLLVFDAQGQQVYQRNLADNGTFQTSAGTAGSWRIRVVFDDLDATVNFRVQKR